jgi:hypothetical protein
MEQAPDLALTRRLAAAIAGIAPARPGGEARVWVDHARRHRVDALLADRVARVGPDGGWPADIGAELSALLRAMVLVDAVRQAEAARVFAALDSRGVRAVVFKGGALAHTLYEKSYLRPCADTDILIRTEDLPSVDAAFVACGYRRPTETSGELITRQCHFERTDASGLHHVWDVHWKIVNVHAVGDALTYDEICRDAVMVKALGSAMAPSPVPAMLLACLHRVAHHNDAPKLVWLLDIHLLAAAFAEEDWRRLLMLARERGVWAACARSLARTREVFDSPLPPFVDAALQEPGDDATSALFDPRLRQIDLMRADLAALPTWSARVRLLRQHVLPPAAFMRARYGIRFGVALPWWYVVRLISGGPRWFRRLRR